MISSRSKSLGLPIQGLASKQAGFTLIEILLVLAIIVLVLSFGMPVVSRITGQNISTSARKITSLIRGVRTDAILLSSIYRIKLDLDKNTYLIQYQKQAGLLDESSLLSFKPDPKHPEDAQSQENGFVTADKYFKEPRSLPGGVVFNGVLKEKEGQVRDGIAYIYFFPNGLNEKAILYLNAAGAKEGGYSLYVHPTAGKVDFYKFKMNQF